MISDKKLDKICNTLGLEVVNDLNSLDFRALQALVVVGTQAIKDAEEELEANEQYQALKENLKAVSAGLKDVKKFQNAKIQYILHVLESKGK